jgi:hypothetical protein
MDDISNSLNSQAIYSSDLNFQVPIVDGPENFLQTFKQDMADLQPLWANKPTPEGEPVRGACFTVIESGGEAITKS